MMRADCNHSFSSARLFLSQKGCKGHIRPDLLKLPERPAAGRPLWLPGTLPELASSTALQLGEYLMYTVCAYVRRPRHGIAAFSSVQI